MEDKHVIPIFTMRFGCLVHKSARIESVLCEGIECTTVGFFLTAEVKKKKPTDRRNALQ